MCSFSSILITFVKLLYSSRYYFKTQNVYFLWQPDNICKPFALQPTAEGKSSKDDDKVIWSPPWCPPMLFSVRVYFNLSSNPIHLPLLAVLGSVVCDFIWQYTCSFTVIFTHLKLCVATATHNFKWVKSTITQIYPLISFTLRWTATRHSHF